MALNVIIDFLTSAAVMFTIIVLIIIVFGVYAVDLVINEIHERKLESSLYRKIEIDEFLKEVNELIAKSRKPNKIARYSIYKAIGLYYKGEIENALEWLKKVSGDVETLNDQDITIIYTIIILKILLKLGYNEQVEAIYQKNKPILDKMFFLPNYKTDAKYITGIYEAAKGNYKEAHEIMLEVKKMPITKLEKTMIAYQNAKICLELEKIEEAEREVEEVMSTKKKTRNVLFIYSELEKIIRERRSSNNTISSVDKDLEEQRQQEALEKMQKEVAKAIAEEEEHPELIQKVKPNIPEPSEEEKNFNAELDALKKNLTEEMYIKSKIDET